MQAGTADAVDTLPDVAAVPARGVGDRLRDTPMWVWLSAILFLILAWGAWHNRIMVDDAFIHLRVVKQIEAGHGPVFNAGERVEASTSPAWTWLLVLLDVVLPLRLEWIAVLTGITLTLAGFVLAVLGAAELAGRRDSKKLLLPLGAIVFCVLPATWTNASTGLENGLVYAWLGASLLVLAYWAKRGWALRWYHAAILGFGPLVRPELMLWSVGLVGVAVYFELRARGVRRALFLVVAAFALPFAYEIFRMGYYGSLVPSSAIAKEASLSYWRSGWIYLHQTLDPYWLLVPLVVVLIVGYAPGVIEFRSAREHRAAATFVVFGVLALFNAIFVVRVGGDLYHARLLLTPLFGYLAPVMVVPWRKAFAGATVLVAWGLAALFLLRTPFDAPVYLNTYRNPITLYDYRYVTAGYHLPWYTGSGAYYAPKRLDAAALPGRDPSVAVWGAGALGYALGPNVYVLDMLGLGDTFTAHLELGPRRVGLAAHEKPLPAPWVAARLTTSGSNLTFADFPLPPFVIGASREIDPPIAETFAMQTAEARRALGCGDIHKLLDAVSGPLTVSKFVSNIFHSFSYTTLRIPAQPHAAMLRFCG